MPGDSGVLVVTRVPSTTTTCTRNRECSGHPAFPTPSKGGETFHQRLGRIAPRDHEVCRQPVDPIRYRLVGSRGSRIRAIVICPALEMRPLNLPAAACNKSPDAFSVIASEAKQSRKRRKWIASSRSLSSGAHSRDPLAPRKKVGKLPEPYRLDSTTLSSIRVGPKAGTELAMTSQPTTGSLANAPLDSVARDGGDRAVGDACPRPVTRATRAALYQRRHAGRSADRRLQQDHRAERILRGKTGDNLFLTRGRLEQEGRLRPCDRGHDRGAAAAARTDRALQYARLRLLRQRRIRHRYLGFQRRAADRPAQRHHLSQSRQCLARQGKLCPRDRRLR